TTIDADIHADPDLRKRLRSIALPSRENHRCRSTRPPSKTSVSCSTTCSRLTATTICPVFPTPPPTCARRCWARPPSSARKSCSRSIEPATSKAAFKQVAEGGWLGLSAPTEYGGQGLPVTLSQVVTEFQSAANMAFSMYGGLTMGATAALIVHGKPEQKQMFVPKMVAGEWTGTMNLTEPQCGTDLGLLRTKAV